MKLDPYLNVDPGTMSPFQHGEVFVTSDGSETDLDLGHYERFIDEELNKFSSFTAGAVYREIIENEREGKYLGGTIQTIPHVTNLIKDKIFKASEETSAEVMIVEVGGTVGDIEGQPFIEAIRQFRSEFGQDNSLFMHLTLLPKLGATGEVKTKPTQHSVNSLRAMGIQPDFLVCRSDEEFDNSIKSKLSLHCDVKLERIFSLETLDTIYAVPITLESQGMGDKVSEFLNLDKNKSDLKEWNKMVNVIRDDKKNLNIGIIGKYTSLEDSYLSVKEALMHAAVNQELNLKIDWILSDEIEKNDLDKVLGKLSGIVIPGGFGPRGIDGMVKCANYSRIKSIPYLGLCLGMQIMVIEYARNVLNLKDANSSEFDQKSKNLVIDFLPGQMKLKETGASMRLGNYPCIISRKSKVFEYYKKEEITERHRHRYEVNNLFKEKLEKEGLISAGTSPDGNLVEIMEVANHPFMIGSQFHPEFLSRPDRPHPLFYGFVSAVNETVVEGDQIRLIQ
jgi:CTP synthase